MIHTNGFGVIGRGVTSWGTIGGGGVEMNTGSGEAGVGAWLSEKTYIRTINSCAYQRRLFRRLLLWGR